ncbi:MAG: SirB2 family protein [Hylemonella sp.]|nr:SirB2 family protein [Hylemonella sp.]
MEYAHIRLLHISCVAISVSLFALRAGLQLFGVDWRRWRWLRIAPHLNDSVLLIAGVTLAWRSALSPLDHAWLGAKILALLLYILIGRLALRPGLSAARRGTAFALALLSVAYILGAALTRSASLTLF